jgi:outer membrane lipoprotein SlyB
MKSHRLIGRVAVVALAFSLILILSGAVSAQQSTASQRRQTTTRPAYERGYLAGYTDGYKAGKDDYNARAARDFQRSSLYQDATRGYENRFGNALDYQDGYRLGFEIAYTDGYFNRTFNSATPARALTLRSQTSRSTVTQGRRTGRNVLIPDGTELRIRLNTTLNTKTNQEGDPFTAQVVEPSTYEGATVYGHIAKIERSGRMTGRTEMALDFDTITLRDGRSGTFFAQIEKVFATESVKSVDEEGNVESASKTKDTEIRTIGGAALGAIIGAIAKGGKGAAIGAIIGAGVGAGSVYVQGNKDLILEPGVQMMVRTSSPQAEQGRQ